MMDDKQHDNDNGETPAAEADAPELAEAAPDADAADAATADPAAAALAAAEAEVADLKDKLLRAVAETENVRRRADREMSDLRKFAVSDFARDMLSVADNLQRAIDAAAQDDGEHSAEVKQLLEGVTLTEKELLHQFEKHGIVRLEPMGEKLDPNLHQAVVQLDVPDAEAGTVVQVMQCGYTIQGRLLRPAMVGVAKGGGAKPAEAAGQAVDTQA